MNTKITIFYADNLDDVMMENFPMMEAVIYENKYHTQPQSKRIKWVKNECKRALKRVTKTAIVTNDYAFIRLVEFSVPKQDFCIYDVEEDEYVISFCELKANPTLDVFDHLYNLTIKEAFGKN